MTEVTMAFPAEFKAVLERARRLTYQEAFALSRQYDRSPDTPVGRARAAFDRVVKEHRLADAKTEWLRAAGDAVIKAISAEPFDVAHTEGWRWATQPVLDVARAILARQYLSPADYDALRRPWDWFVDGGAATSAGLAGASGSGRAGKPAGHVLELPWLEERIGVNESFVKGMVLVRATYAVAYVIVRNRNGSFRITHRGTGFHDYFFDTVHAQDQWALDGELDLLTRRFKLNGAQLQRDVVYFEDAESFAKAVEALPDD